MPYIKDKQIRKALCTGELFPANCGELNYKITQLIHQYTVTKGLRYETLNEVIGVLSCVKTEFERTVIGPYESKKRLENGAVSELDSIGLEEVR